MQISKNIECKNKKEGQNDNKYNRWNIRNKVQKLGKYIMMKRCGYATSRVIFGMKCMRGIWRTVKHCKMNENEKLYLKICNVCTDSGMINVRWAI